LSPPNEKYDKLKKLLFGCLEVRYFRCYFNSNKNNVTLCK